MRRALKIDEASFGEHHPTVAIDLNNLAHVAEGHQPHGGGGAADAASGWRWGHHTKRKKSYAKRHPKGRWWLRTALSPPLDYLALSS